MTNSNKRVDMVDGIAYIRGAALIKSEGPETYTFTTARGDYRVVFEGSNAWGRDSWAVFEPAQAQKHSSCRTLLYALATIDDLYHAAQNNDVQAHS